MLKVYGDLRSGNCYKVKLLMYLLDIEHEWIHVDILNAETYTEEFKAINPNAKIPALVMTRGDCLWESNAILNYLADGTDYLPSKKFVRSQVLQWQFFEQYSHEPFIAVARYIKVFLGMPEDRKEEYQAKMSGGYKALDVMEQHLKKNIYFVAGMYSIADMSLYAYTHVAEQGGFDLSHYPSIISWMSRIESKLKHQTIQDFINTAKRKKRAEQRLQEAIAEISPEKEEPKTHESDIEINPESKADVQSQLNTQDLHDSKLSSLDAKEQAYVKEVLKEIHASPSPIAITKQAHAQVWPSIHSLMISDIDGRELSFSDYEGKVLLLVNVASECGLTPQYRGLQGLYDKYMESNFTVIGLPCNQFGSQEPGSEHDIKDFCLLEYSVSFPMTSKIEVNGARRHPLYDLIAGDQAQFPGDISWNFEKFLIGKDGCVIKRYPSDLEPHAAELVKDIELALQA